MTIRELLSATAKQLQPKKITCAADRDLGRFEAEILLAHVVKKDRAWLLTHDDYCLSSTIYRLFRSLVARRLKHEPIAYIQGEKEFYGLPFSVNRHTLIPRPETEQVVELACAAIKRKPKNKKARHAAPLLWDIGTGCGAIAIATAKHIPGCHVLATDISSASLTIAKKNAQRNKVSNIKFLKSNLVDLSARRFLEKMKTSHLVITANLPYLPTNDKKTMDRDVVGYEPSSALFSGPDGLALIEKLLRQLAAFDIHFGTLLLEHDPRQTKKLHAMAMKLLPHGTVQTHKDLAGRDRVTEITRP